MTSEPYADEVPFPSDDTPQAPVTVHVMLDLETFDTGNTAMPVSIGAVKFTASTILDRFHVGIDPMDAERYGLKIGARTILWWLDPERDEARKKWLALPKVDLFAALDGFALWCNETPSHQRGRLWGNGSTFDNVVLRNAFSAVHLGDDFPFSFRDDACYRTVKNMAPDVKLERVGTHHDAADDAESQARHLQQLCARLGIAL